MVQSPTRPASASGWVVGHRTTNQGITDDDVPF